ncbi:MAG: hypothetical protein ACJASX_004402 [Limisphaerales bacterium]|jgi:hypothetical protein
MLLICFLLQSPPLCCDSSGPDVTPFSDLILGLGQKLNVEKDPAK